MFFERLDCIMNVVKDTQELKHNFLEFWKNISIEDIQSLITLKETISYKCLKNSFLTRTVNNE